MRILFLGDVVGNSGCSKITNNLLSQIKLNKIDFVIVNGENSDQSGVGFTFQEYKNLPIEPHDEKLDWILTEKYLYKV